MSYTPPVKDMMFVIENLADMASVSRLPGLDDSNLDTASAILEEGAKLAAEVIGPLNVQGDRQPSTWHDGHVKATPGEGMGFVGRGEGVAALAVATVKRERSALEPPGALTSET